MSDNIPSQNSAILFHFLPLVVAKADLQLDLTLVPLITMGTLFKHRFIYM